MTQSDEPEYMSPDQAKDEIQDRIDELGSTPFEHLSKFVIEEVEDPDSIEVTPEGGDEGLDIFGHVGTSIYQCSFGVEVKRHSDPVGSHVVRKLSGALNRHGCGFGGVVTNSTFTDPAIEEATETDGPPVTLIDGNNLTDLMVEHSIGLSSHDDGYRIDKEFWGQFEKFKHELISSAKVPQADNLETLRHALRGISNGKQFSPEIVEHLIDRTDDSWTRRQADYYTLAAKSLGFLKQKDGEYEGQKMRRWVLTDEGERYLELLESDDEKAQEFLHEKIRNLDIFEIVINRIQSELIDQDEIKSLIEENTEVTGTTVGRRGTTIRSWLKDLDEVKVDDDGKTTYDYYEKDLFADWDA